MEQIFMGNRFHATLCVVSPKILFN